MERNRQAEQTGIEEKKADHTNECLAMFEIEFGARRNKRRDDRWIDNVIKHGEVTPIGGEKGFHTERSAVIDRRYRIALSILRLAEKFFERRIGLGTELGGLGIMALGQLLGRRLRGSINYGKIEMRIGVRRITGDGLE